MADILAEYAGLKGQKLSKQTEKFAVDPQYPTPLRENVEYFREIAYFGAHTQKDEVGAIVDVSYKEADWTLELLTGFFDYFIVSRERHKRQRVEFDEKIKQAGRKPINKPDERSSSARTGVRNGERLARQDRSENRTISRNFNRVEKDKSGASDPTTGQSGRPLDRHPILASANSIAN